MQLSDQWHSWDTSSGSLGPEPPNTLSCFRAPTTLEGIEVEKLRLREVRRLSQGCTVRQRVTGAPACSSPPYCLLRAGSLSPSSWFSPASLRCAAHPHVHQHARPDAGVYQWPVSTPQPQHWTYITTLDPHSHQEVGIPIIPTTQMRSERLRNLPKVIQLASKWRSQDWNPGPGAVSRA